MQGSPAQAQSPGVSGRLAAPQRILISKEAGFCTYLSARAVSSVGSEMLGEGVDRGPSPRED